MDENQKKSVFGFIITIVAAVGLTFLAIPLLFFAACIPLMMGKEQEAAMVFNVVLAVAVASGFVMSALVRNPGVRWALIVFSTALAIVGGLFFIH